MPSEHTGREPLLRKLGSVITFTEDERRALLNLPMHTRELPAGQDIVREGDRPGQCCLLLEGFAHRYKVVGDGRRQVLSFHVPGDMPDLLSLHLRRMDHNLSVLSRSTIGVIPHGSIHRLIREYPRLADALWRDTLIDSAVFREWMVGMGRRDAHARIAHLFCELMTKMRAIGLAQGNSVQLPLTQGVISDALGLSAVHVNRVVQQLRAEGLIRWQGRCLTVENWVGLAEVAEFDPGYLHLCDLDAEAA